jgi:signal transduction histidine kinase/CheY-like chemotaxis protein
MQSFVRRTLFWKYAAYFSGLVSALLILSGGVGGYFAYRESTAALEALQRATAQVAASEIASFIGRLEDDMQSVAVKFNTSGAIDEEDLQAELVALLRHQPSITELQWIAADGREKFALSRIARDTTDSGRNWSNDRRFVATRDSPRYIGPVYFRRETEPYLSLAVTRSPGGPVLGAEVNLKFVWDVISQIRIGKTGVAYVVDGEGQLVSHPEIGLVLRRTDVLALPQVRRSLAGNDPEASVDGEARNVEGLPVLAVAVPIPHLGWTVFAEQSREEALRPVYASIARSIALVVLGVIASVTASLLFARGMVRPIRQLEARAREIGEGKLDQRIEVGTGDELEALGFQFNRMAQRLQEIHTTQETRIAERTHDLALANDAKTRFLAAASHDLRQPIHALALFVGQLRADAGSPQAPALLEKIERSVEALEELLEALLDLSKLDVGAVIPQPKPFAVHPFLSRLVSDFAPAAEAKGLALTLVPTKLWVYSDPLLLERILRNLVANAIRYTADGRILIGCRRRGENVDLVVADTGLGIAPVHLPHVFQEFYQAGPLQGGLSKGLGLGLAIVKRLSVLLDHRIALESIPGKGTVVRIRVSRAAPQPPEHVKRVALIPDLRGTRVLVVDDEASARDAIQGLLAQWGCEVIAVEGGDEAVAQARIRRPDIVLCDLSLADGDSGVAVVDRLRREHGAGLACAFITGESAPERISEARAVGHPIAFKPTKPAKLRALIEHLLHSP